MSKGKQSKTYKEVNVLLGKHSIPVRYRSTITSLYDELQRATAQCEHWQRKYLRCTRNLQEELDFLGRKPDQEYQREELDDSYLDSLLPLPFPDEPKTPSGTSS